MTMDAQTPQASKSSAWSYVTFWKVDAAEVERQVANYSTLKVIQSARGASLLACLLSVAITLLFLGVFGHSMSTAVAGAVLWSFMGFMMYRGYRWAFVVAMLLWSIEKLVPAGVSVMAGRVPYSQVLWWLGYINLFYFGFKVEMRRAQMAASLQPLPDVAAQPVSP
jgi:hypothetical protein